LISSAHINSLSFRMEISGFIAVIGFGKWSFISRKGESEGRRVVGKRKSLLPGVSPGTGRRSSGRVRVALNGVFPKMTFSVCGARGGHGESRAKRERSHFVPPSSSSPAQDSFMAPLD